MSIYKLTSSHTDQVYIGKTKQALKTRFSNHKTNYKRHLEGKYGNCQAKHILKYSDAKITLVEECGEGICVAGRERYWIENTDNCVNKVIPTQTPMEHYWSNDGYRERQKLAKRMAYANRTPEQIAKMKEYRNTPEYKARERESAKKSRAKCRDSRNERRRNDRVACELCGFIICKDNLRRHQLSKNCIKKKT